MSVSLTNGWLCRGCFEFNIYASAKHTVTGSWKAREVLKCKCGSPLEARCPTCGCKVWVRKHDSGSNVVLCWQCHFVWSRYILEKVVEESVLPVKETSVI